MAMLHGILLFIFLPTYSAVVISSSGSNATFNLTVPQNTTVSVSFEKGSLMFDIHTSTPPTTMKYKNEYYGRISSIVKVTGGGVQFTFHNISERDAGNYVCLDGKRDVIPRCGDSLVVTQSPLTPEIQEEGNSTEGGNLVLTCSSSSRSLPQNHNLKMVYHWKRNDENVSGAANSETIGPSLSVKHPSKRSNNDYYTCQAQEIHGLKSQWSRPFVLNVDSFPDILNKLDRSLLSILFIIPAFMVAVSTVIVVKCRKKKENNREKRITSYLSPFDNRQSVDSDRYDTDPRYANDPIPVVRRQSSVSHVYETISETDTLSI